MKEAVEEKERRHEQKLVKITIDNKIFEVERGQYTVAKLKLIGGIDPSYDLLEQKNGKLVPLPDDGRTHIEGREVFFSQPKSGGSA